MPPKDPERAAEKAAREARIQQAVAEARTLEKPNFSALSRKYDLRRDVIKYHLTGILTQRVPVSLKNRFTPAQDTALTKYCHQLDEANIAATGGMIEITGNYLLRRGPRGRDCALLSKMWAYRFLERMNIELRHPNKVRVNFKRLKDEHLDVFVDWFSQLKSKVEEHDIGPSNIYNMSLGFQFHQRGLRRGVVTDIEGSDTSAAARLKSGFLTTIECVAANGFAVPPLFIVKGDTNLDWWDDSPDVPDGAREALSPTGWVTPKLAMHWIRHFDEHTKGRVSRGRRRLLLIDGHESHLPPEFFDICEARKIIILSLVPHARELLQPLDGQPFLQYEEVFHSPVNNGESTPTNIEEFLSQVMSARRAAFNELTIRDMFANCGIWPIDLEKIIRPLRDQLEEIQETEAVREQLCSEPTPEPRAPSPPPRAIRIVRARAEEAVALQKKDANQVRHQLRQIYNLNLRTCGMVLQLQEDMKRKMEFQQQRPQNRPLPDKVLARRDIKTSRLALSRVGRKKLAAQARRRKNQAKYGIAGASKRLAASVIVEID